MLITPEVPPEERPKVARKLVEALSKNPSDRTAQILVEFRKLNQTVDETELWCLLMRELVTVGRDAVPQLCAELDRTTEDRMLRRLGFALRAIGDARAVPALIRAIPQMLLPSSSDYGLIVSDEELTDFMQTHDLDQGKGGTYFDLGRPVCEIIGVSTGQPERRRRATAPRLSDLGAHGPTIRRMERGSSLSRNSGRPARLAIFCDLDTGYRPSWPTQIPRDEASRDAKQWADWASQCGVDLMCITHRSPDGTETYVLWALGMKVREINPGDLRNLDKLIAAGTLPEGRPVDELLMHYDTESQQLVLDANAAFLFVTREGSMGLIETTDRVIRTADQDARVVQREQPRLLVCKIDREATAIRGEEALAAPTGRRDAPLPRRKNGRPSVIVASWIFESG